jgi:hypothetical protein
MVGALIGFSSHSLLVLGDSMLFLRSIYILRLGENLADVFAE